MRFANSFALLTLALKWEHAFSSVFVEDEGVFANYRRRVRTDNPLISHPMPPNPEPYQVTYDDGTKSPLLRLRIDGDETDLSKQIWEETLDGFTVAPSGGKYVYVEVNDDSGELIETDLVVGVDDPYVSHIRKGAAAAAKKISMSNNNNNKATAIMILVLT
mmetsp:Transcript_7093/g.10808  ORF Transcript_7093/g.10808 Transcript_7093/m.10808 type:complete len:161 (-) Transcript_7093:1192-1674(-)